MAKASLEEAKLSSMRGRLLLVVLLACAASISFGQSVVARNGKAVATIVTEPEASPTVRHAAEELSKYLSEITEANIPCTIGRSSRPTDIVVGRGRLAQRLCPDIAWGNLPPEEVVLRSTKQGLVVSGGSDRGTLYAAYRLLEREGVRWWTPWATNVPKIRNLRIPALSVQEQPAMEYRSAYAYPALDPDWAVRNYCNYDLPSLRTDQGGGIKYAGFVHTYNAMAPPEKYFRLHPEWYSLINGKRTAENAQLCTTNPELRAFVLEQVKKELREHPDATIVSVSQNDCWQYCQCDRCRALTKQEGSPAVLVLDLANCVAAGIAKEFPNVAVDTLAYQWSQHAPKTMRPLPNVIVRLCSIECDFGQPIEAPKNVAFSRDIQAWSQLTNRLYVWDYITDFPHYLQPMGNEEVLGPNLKYFAGHGVKGVFEEGDYTSNGGSMMELKTWLLAHLLWNPAADSQALTAEFLKGYYGAAAKPINDYLNLMEDSAAKNGVTCYSPTGASYLTYPVLRAAEADWEEAERKVAKDPEQFWRVEESHLSVQFVYLTRWDELMKATNDAGDPWPFPAGKTQLAEKWLRIATDPGPPGWTPIFSIDEPGYRPQNFITAILRDSKP
jgi:hypothetical protein